MKINQLLALFHGVAKADVLVVARIRPSVAINQASVPEVIVIGRDLPRVGWRCGNADRNRREDRWLEYSLRTCQRHASTRKHEAVCEHRSRQNWRPSLAANSCLVREERERCGTNGVIDVEAHHESIGTIASWGDARQLLGDHAIEKRAGPTAGHRSLVEGTVRYPREPTATGNAPSAETTRAAGRTVLTPTTSR